MPATATIIISPIGTQRVGVPFAVTGTYELDQPTWADILEYTDGSNDPDGPTQLPPIETNLGVSSISFQHAGLPVGTHTISIRDRYTGTVVTSNAFDVIPAEVIIPTVPSNLTPGVTFTFVGLLSNYLAIPSLAYSIDGGPPIALGGVTLTGWSYPVVAPAVGSHSISVSDGTISASVSFVVSSVPKTITPTTPVGAVAGRNFAFLGSISGYTTVPSLTYRFDSAVTGIPITGVTLTGWAMVIQAPGPAGNHTLTVTDGTIVSSVSLVIAAAAQSITVNAPTGAVAGQSFTFTGILQNYTTIPALTYSIDGGAAVTMTGVTVTGWSMSIVAPAAGTHTISVTDGTIASTSVSFTVTAQNTATRIWYYNPGEDGTFWVDPFSTTASWINSGALVTMLRNGVYSTPTGLLHLPGTNAYSWYVGGPSDPVMIVTDGTYSVSVHVPAGAVVTQPDDQTIGIVDTTKPYMMVGIGNAVIRNAAGTIVSSVPAAGGGTITGVRMDVSDGSGQFMMDAVTGQPGTGNGYASISEYDLQQAVADPNYVVQHMVQYFLDPRQCASTGPIWPLKAIDNSFANTGNLPQGLTVGIPFNAIYPAGKVGNRAFKFWWDLFQQFGGEFYNVAGTGCLTLDAYPLSSPTIAFCALLAAEMNDLVAQLCILNPGDAPNYTSSATPGAQYSLATQKGRIAGQPYSPQYPPPPPLDLSPTNGVNVAPHSFGAWYPSGYNRIPQNSGTPTPTPTPSPTPTPMPPPTAVVTWSPSNKASTVALTNNNRTATSGGTSTPGSAKQAVIATNPLPVSGPVAWDVVIAAPTQNWAAGVADTTFALTGANLGADGHGMGAYPATGPGSQPPNTVYFQGMQLTAGNGIASVPGDIMSFVLNGTGLFFSTAAMRQTSGVNFNNSTSANPLTGAGAFQVTNTGIPLYPVWNDAESGGVATLLDGSSQAPLSPFLQAYIAANPSVQSLSAVTSSPGTKSIVPTQPQGVVATSSFAFSGTLVNYTTIPTLSYRIDGGASIVIPPAMITLGGWNVTTTVPASGAHTIVVSDGAITGQTTFTAAPTGGITRVVAPLTGTVTKGTWVKLQTALSGVSLPGGYLPICFYLLPAQYDPTVRYPILFWCHPDQEGNSAYSSGDTNLPYLDADPSFNTVAFRTANPCIVVCYACYQLDDGYGNGSNSAYVNGGGWVNTGRVADASHMNGETGFNVYAMVALAKLFAGGTDPNTGTFLAGDPTRRYLTGFSLGAISTDYLMLKYNYVNGIELIFTAGIACVGGVVEKNGYGVGPNAADIAAMQSAPLWSVCGANDGASKPADWDLPLWRALAGNSNYPPAGGTAVQSRAGTSNYYLWYVAGLGHDSSRNYQTNPILLAWLFGWIATTPTTPTVNITGANLSNTSGVASSPIGTVVGSLTATASGGTLQGTTFTVTPTTSFKVVGTQVQFASASVAAGTYTLTIRVAATNAANSPQSYPVIVTVGPAGAKTSAALLAYLNSIAGTYTISSQFIERGPLTPIQNIFNTTGYWLGGICGDYWYTTSTILTADTSVNPIAKSYWANGGLFFLIPSIPNPTTRGAAVDTSSVNGSQLTVSGTSTNTNLNASLDSIIAGLLDLQSAGVIVIFRPYPEMNGTWFWWGAGLLTAAQYVALWQYTWNRVTAAGVTNVLWLWAPNAGFQSTAQDRYPGAAYVDIVGQDLYTDNPASVGLPGYQFLSQYGKVQVLSEFGPGSGPAGNPNFSEPTLISALNTTLPKVAVWTQWWDQNSNGPGWGMASVQNVQAALADPRVLNRGEIAFFNQVTAPNPLVTMPMGDAMTIGGGTGASIPPGSYRAPLLTNIAAAGYTLQFCGDKTVNPGPLTGLNQRHEGIAPITAAQMQTYLATNAILATYQPALVILLIGYNALFGTGAVTPAAAYAQLTALCQFIIQQRPGVRIIVSNEPGITGDRGNTSGTTMGQYNALIASGIASVASNISFADINSGWQASYTGPDGVNPNTAGCAYMAQVYQSAIVAVYGA